MLFGGHKCLPGSDLPCCAAPDHHARHAVYSGRNARTAAPAHNHRVYHKTKRAGNLAEKHQTQLRRTPAVPDMLQGNAAGYFCLNRQCAKFLSIRWQGMACA